MGNLFTYNTGEYIMQMFLIKKGKESRRIISTVRAFLSFLIDIPPSVKKNWGKHREGQLQLLQLDDSMYNNGFLMKVKKDIFTKTGQRNASFET